MTRHFEAMCICASRINTVAVVLLRVLRHPAWSLSPYTSSRATLAVDVGSTNNCTSRGSFFKIPSKTLQICHRLFHRFLYVSRQLLCQIRQSGRSCDKYAALITTLRYCLVCNASNCGNVINTSSSLFLTDGVVTPFAPSRFNNLTINSACRGSGSYSIQLLSPSEFQRTHRFRILTSLASSRSAPRTARNLIG